MSSGNLARSNTMSPSQMTPASAHAAAARAVIQRSSRSFSIAVRFLPAELRDKVTALYAWCRCVDDAVDQASDNQQAERTLHVLTEDLIRSIDGNEPLHPASTWIQPLIAHHAIDPQHAHELIAGMHMDLHHDRVDTEADLERYCYHAAGTVGLMLTQLMGVRNRESDRHAIALGIAMQLTNIARDVREDALRGRSYLPRIAHPLAADPSQVKAAVTRILATAEAHYRTAIEGLKFLPWNCRLAIRIALFVYREIGRQIQRNNYEVLQGRTVISRPRLIVVALLACCASLKDDIRIAVKCLQKSVFQTLKEQTMINNADSQSSQVLSSPLAMQLSTPRQARQTVYLGLSLTLIMATALFAIVYFHPKIPEYSLLPLIYAGICFLGSLTFHRLSAPDPTV